MNGKKISIIVPIYNSEKDLEKSINSICAQTHADLEILLIDDGSTDSSGKICDEVAQRDTRIRVFHKENGGVSSARNLGVRMATGAYIGFVDADDWIEPTMYSAMLEQAEHNNADIVLCGIYDHYKENVKIINKAKCNHVTIKSNDEALQDFILDRGHSLVLWNKLWKRELFAEIFFPEGRIFEDASVTWKMVIRANKVVYLPDAYYHYYENAGSLVHTPSLHHLFDHWLAAKERFDVLAKKYPALQQACLKECALSIARTWGYYEQASQNCQVPDQYITILQDMNGFARKYGKEVLKGPCALHVKIGILLAFFNTKAVRKLSYWMNLLSKQVKGKKNALN